MWCNFVHFDGHLSNFESALHENDHNPPQQSYNQHNDQELIQYTPYCPRYLYSLFGDIFAVLLNIVETGFTPTPTLS